MAKKAPSWLVPEGYRIRDKLVDSIKRWRIWSAQISHDTGGSKPMMQKKELLDVDGWDVHAIAASDLGLLWASNSNMISLLFWLNYEIIRSEAVLKRVRTECLHSASPRPDGNPVPHIELAFLLEMPFLQACFAETLRLRTHILITRYPDTHDMMINEWRLPAKNLIMTCPTVPHMDQKLWNTRLSGTQPLETFWPPRFLKNPDDYHDMAALERDITESSAQPRVGSDIKSSDDPAICAAQPQFSTNGLEGIWIPFGGGGQMCPGRKLAKAEIFHVTALLVTRFDIELCHPEKEAPMDWSYFGTGVLKPAAKVRFWIRKRVSA